MSSKLITTRRDLMRAVGALGGAGAIGCGSDDPPVAEQEADIFQCLWNGRQDHGLAPRGVFGQIEHVVVLMMENRSFDHYFGALSIPAGRTDRYGNDMGGEGRNDVFGLTGDEVNPNLAGEDVPVFRLRDTVIGDIAHEWDNCHKQFDYDGNGRMDGFVREHETDLLKGAEAYCASSDYFGNNAGCPAEDVPMGIYGRSDLPVSYALADNYTLCDQWYSSVLGPTWPNRFYLHSASSQGEQNNKPVLGMRTIWEKMREQCLPALNYYCDLPWAHVVGEGYVLGSEVGDGIFGGVLEQFHASQPGFGSFYQDVQNDDLPAYSLIDPGYSSGYDDHPPSDTKLGQAFISYVYRILASNPEVWRKTLFIITYDEHGSFYDHVTPPGPNDEGSHQLDEFEPFRQLGVRVPSLVIGPHVKKGYVSHEQLDHVSVLSTLYDRFDLSANDVGYLNERHKNTNTLADCMATDIDPANTPGPADIPVLEFSETELMDWVERPFPDGQVGLAEMVDRGEIPADKDLRRFRREQMLEFLEIGEKVGAIKVTR
jgi:phospholipase C